MAFTLGANALLADSVLSTDRKIAKLGDGIYMIRHKDPFPGWVDGNTTVIIGEREVFVVDSCQLSSSAQEDIAQIRKWTEKPVRYLLNTHWHLDHTAGNKDYLDAFPSLAIIAHRETRNMMEATRVSLPKQGLKDATTTQAKLQEKLEKGKLPDGQPLGEREKRETIDRLATISAIIKQFNGFVYQGPTGPHSGFRSRTTV